MTSNALIEVLQERIKQDEMWGDVHDDMLTSQDWDRFIRPRLHEFYDTEDLVRRRELMIHIAALALACLQADDRGGLAMQA